ncbi:MAG: WbqC family protein [Candidatus Pacearchaeota archaeon]
MKIVSIHQPSYFPWLGLLDKIAKTNTFILLDDAQVVKGSYQYRNIFYCNGEKKFLTLPINYKLGITFKEIKLKNNKWKVEHLNKLYNYYRRAPYFNEVYQAVENLLQKDYDDGLDLLKDTMLFAMEKLDINVSFLISSQYNVQGVKGDKVLGLCKAVGAQIYLAGQGSREYMSEYLHKFNEAGIEVKWHNFRHPFYNQVKGNPFIDGLSCLDIFFFEGFENSKKIFWENIKNG